MAENREEARQRFIEESDRPVLVPDARSFADVLEYIGEWQDAKAAKPEPRYLPEETPDANDWERKAWMRDGRNRIGPYCRVKTQRYSFRSIAVRATDAVMEAVAPRIVTPDDDLSFDIIEHERTGYALVVLNHGYIIGSHWLAYIDPATIPDSPVNES